ncbi:MAG: type III-B CRISPR-associated protein Cas10/Cmr2 [Alphaproteobacteria bacterium]|nr:type III-B CRISPR-associated protein Cas10/Cmr2 [Alphaproteobacteria bacterium]
MTRDERFWRLKATALLLPTPLAGLDPDGEPPRADRVRERFGLPTLTDDERRLLEGCHRDATAAQLGRPDAGGVTRESRLLHPLSAARDDAAEPVRLDDASQAWEAWLPALPVDPSDPVRYRRLWRAFVDPPDGPLRGLVHSPRMPDHTVWAQRSLAAALVGARLGSGDAALVLLSVGPVQALIEASRRTNDLWGGSYLMSFLSAQMLCALARRLGPDAVVTPWPAGLALVDHLLEMGPSPSKSSLVQPALPAKVMAIVPDAEADALAAEALRAASDTWQDIGRSVRDGLGGLLRDADPQLKSIWTTQLDAFLERTAAVIPWASDPAAVGARLSALGWPAPKPLSTAGEGYGPSSGLLWQARSGASRSILPRSCPSEPRPKCTVCGRRDQLGPALGEDHQRRRGYELWAHRRWWSTRSDEERESVSLSDGEALCAVCLTKRFAPEHYFGRPDGPLGLDWVGSPQEDRPLLRFPSVSSVACAPFRLLMTQARVRRGVLQDWQALSPEAEQARQQDLSQKTRAWTGQLNRLLARDALNFTPPGNGLPGLGPVGRFDDGPLDVDGAWCDDDAYVPERLWRDYRGRPVPEEDPNYQRVRELVPEAGRSWRSVREALGCAPSPYYAVLYLDGDQMSLWLNGAHERTPKVGEVWGGPPLPADEADAPRPVYPALQGELSRRLCRLAAGDVAERVHGHLGRLVYCGGDDVVALLPLQTSLRCAWSLVKLLQSRQRLGPKVTASAGLAIVHMRDPLGLAIQQARDAEQRAKKTRNRLCVTLSPRSGAPLEVALPWLRDASGIKMVPALLELLATPDPEAPGEHAVNLRLIDALRREAPVLAALPAGAIRSRLDRLLRTAGAKSLESIMGPVPEEQGAQAGWLEDLIQTLLLVRFLAREEHGVPTRALLDALPAAPEPLP